MALEIIEATRLEIPAYQLMLYIGVVSVSTLLRRERLTLLLNYVFVFYWGFMANAPLIREAFHTSLGSILLYFASGALLLIMVIVAFFRD